MQRGSRVRKGARRGVNFESGGLERTVRVRKVTRKWKAAKVSWQSLNCGSVKMALFVKTWGVSASAHRERRVGVYDSDGGERVDHHP